MKRRTVFGLVTAGAVGLVAAGGAVAYGAHGGGRHASAAASGGIVQARGADFFREEIRTRGRAVRFVQPRLAGGARTMSGPIAGLS